MTKERRKEIEALSWARDPAVTIAFRECFREIDRREELIGRLARALRDERGADVNDDSLLHEADEVIRG